MAAPRVKRLLIMAGGTGGHVYPALATAEVMRAAGYDVQWLGTRKGIEARLVPQAGIPLHFIRVTGLRGKRLAVLLQAPFLLTLALVQAIAVLLRIRPSCVLGMGGFASGPGGVGAWLMRIPLVIQEQNAIPGTTNRLLARVATRVLEGFEGAFGMTGARFTGNPVRRDIAALAPPRERRASRGEGALQVLVVGGSLGASALNEVVPAALAALPVALRPRVRHQTGTALFDETRQRYLAAGVDADVSAYIDDMAAAYAWADVVVCRAGALTVAELAAAGVASLLVPYPHAIDDHQTRNAQWLVARGGAMLLPQDRLSAEVLAQRLRDWAARPQQLEVMAQAARACGTPRAAEAVARNCMEVASG